MATFWRRVASLLCVIGVVASWVIKAEICSGLQKSTGAGALSFDKPYFINYVIVSGYTIFLLAWLLGKTTCAAKVQREIRYLRRVRFGGGDGSDEDEEDEDPNAPRDRSPTPSETNLLRAMEAQHPRDREHSFAIPGRSNSLAEPASPRSAALLPRHLQARLAGVNNASAGGGKPPRSHRRTIVYTALALSAMYMVCGLLYVLSLSRTPVSVNTTIYNSQCVVVFLLSVWLLKERVTRVKVLSVLVCVGGVVLVALTANKHAGDSDDATLSTTGVIFVFGSMVLYAIYEVLFKLLSAGPAGAASPGSAAAYQTLPSHAREGVNSTPEIGKDPLAGLLVQSEHVEKHRPIGSFSMPATSLLPAPAQRESPVAAAMLFLGCLGFFNLVLYWPGMFVANAAGWEEWQAPDEDVRRVLLISMGLDAILNGCMLLGIVWSTPLFMTVGTLLTIPSSIFADVWFHGYSLSPGNYGGIGLIVVGFLGLTLSKEPGEH